LRATADTPLSSGVSSMPSSEPLSAVDSGLTAFALVRLLPADALGLAAFRFFAAGAGTSAAASLVSLLAQ
jgi:hypothetical protein